MAKKGKYAQPNTWSLTSGRKPKSPPKKAKPRAEKKQPAPKPIPAEGEEMPLTPLQKIWELVKTILTCLIMAAAAAMMIFTAVSVTSFDRTDRDLFGYKAFIVRSDSMSATDFSAGDLVLIREVDPATLEAGDIISFRSEDPAVKGEVFTHKIRQRTTNASGDPAFVTYGTTTGIDDLYTVSYPSVVGKYQGAIPKLGSFFAFMKTTQGYICCIFLPFVLLLVIQGGSSLRLVRQLYKEKQAAAQAEHQAKLEKIAAQQAALEAQWQQMQQMMEEMKRLQDQLRQE